MKESTLFEWKDRVRPETDLIHPPNHLDQIKPGLRNAYQWLAMVTMLLDHIGYWDNIAPLRAAGRVAMPLYCILFVISIRKNQVDGTRLLIIAILSQIPFMLYIEAMQFNIIFGFCIFYWLVKSQQKQDMLQTTAAFIVLVITGLPVPLGQIVMPVSYGWYLYATLFIFYRIERKAEQRFAFAMITCIYVWMARYWVTPHATGFPRQLIAIVVPFIDWIKLPRPNKYLYRYFYPGHLAVLAIIKISLTGFTFGVFNGFWHMNGPADDTWQTTTSYEPNSFEDALDAYFLNTVQDPKPIEHIEDD